MDSIPPTPQHSQWNTTKTESIPRRPGPSSALNLLSLVASTKLEFFDVGRLLLNQPAHHIVGTGAFSTVETGRTMDNRLVAVKKNKVLGRQLAPFIDEIFEKHINQFCLEVRVLTHSSLREHPNILQLYGICIDSSADHPVLSLVLEYSSLGSLTYFLKAGQPATSSADRLDLILQAATGLEALHSVKVCHGDVKTQNSLVFNNEGKLRLKLSDFGQSIVALQDDPSQVPVPLGTRLLNAPEIRKGSATGYSAFTIEDAIATDIYSFGLMTWEILKNGASFFDDGWILGDSKNLSIDEKEVYLNSLTSEALYLHALRFIETIKFDSYAKNQISVVLRESLQEFPNKRASIATLANFLKPEALSSLTGTDESRHSTSDESILDLLFQPSLTAWTERQSMYDIYHSGLYNSFLVGKEYPINLRERILSELKLIATSNAIQDHACAHAALTVSECYTLGFGSNHDNKEVLYWLLEAAIRGCYKASLWYHRVCQAFGVEPVPHERLLCAELIEAHLYVVPTERYLLSRIHYVANSKWRQVSEATDMSAAKDLTGLTQYLVFGLEIFSSWELDNLLPLHFY
ncbi:kinase-like protein [Acephala macrosclerotiorum]|nr:kinase-like protein [Acephala macrosclerotiorum]